MSRHVLVLAATALEAPPTGRPPTERIITGIGAVNTAHALTLHLATREKPSLVIQTGIAGAYVPTGLSVGDVVIADAEIYGDLGVLLPGGWRPLEEIGIPLIEAGAGRAARFNAFSLDEALVAEAMNA